MTERLKELERQADDYADGLGLAGDAWCDAQSTRFAELLIEDTVRRCCQHLTNIGQDYAREQLERHFGVKK